MVTADLKQKIIAALDELDEAQAERVLRYVENLRPIRLRHGQELDDDPTIGLIDDNEPFSARDAKKILREEITRRSGWTQKDRV